MALASVTCFQCMRGWCAYAVEDKWILFRYHGRVNAVDPFSPCNDLQGRPPALLQIMALMPMLCSFAQKYSPTTRLIIDKNGVTQHR